MTRLSRRAFLAGAAGLTGLTLAATAVGGRAAGGQFATAAETLERRVDALETRVAALTPTATPAFTPTPPSSPGWSLAWEDTFDGAGLNAATWTSGENSWGGQVNGSEYQAWKAANAVVEGGRLRLVAKREAHLGKQYTGGIVHTKGKREFLAPVRVEMRATYPAGNGFWPGLWLLHDTGAKPFTYEIDILEVMGQKPVETYHTYHWYAADGAHREIDAWRKQADGFHLAPHVYAVEWLPRSVEWFIDGRSVQRVSADENAQVVNVTTGRSVTTGRPVICDRPMHLILDLSLGGWGGNAPDATTPLPASLDIEFVRVWEWR